MSETPSSRLLLGNPAPDFTLPDTVSGQTIALKQLSPTHGLIVVFICNHCPYVIHIADTLFPLLNEYQARGFAVVAINSNDIANYPADAPEKMRELAKQYQFRFPYCFDETQAVAKAYQAACTPDFFVFDKELTCVYCGQFDDARPGNQIPPSGADLRNALEALMTGVPVNVKQSPSVGCNIKWK